MGKYFFLHLFYSNNGNKYFNGDVYVGCISQHIQPITHIPEKLEYIFT